jgi:hypothetical protein
MQQTDDPWGSSPPRKRGSRGITNSARHPLDARFRGHDYKVPAGYQTLESIYWRGDGGSIIGGRPPGCSRLGIGIGGGGSVIGSG